MFFLRDIRQQKIGNVRENAVFCEVEMSKENDGSNQKDIDESRQCRFGKTKGERNQTRKIL